MTTHRYLLGTFSNENDVLHAVTEARRSGLDVDDVYTPYAVHGLDRAMGLRPSRLTWVCFLGGFLGVALMLYFEFWTSAQDWPLNVGGKPFDSLPAFIPIGFEMTILFAGLSSVLALFLRCKLWPGKRARVAGPRVTDDQFVVVVRLEGASFSADDVRSLFERHHLVEFEERIGEAFA